MTRAGPRCRACGRRITFAVTVATRTAMPLDPTPNPAGNVTLRPTANGHLLADVWANPTAAAGHGTRWMPHAATCRSAGSATSSEGPKPESPHVIDLTAARRARRP